MRLENQDTQEFSGNLAVFFLSVLLVCAASGATAVLVYTFSTLPDLAQIKSLISGKVWQALVNPEPVERAAYLAAVLAVLPAILAAFFILRGRTFPIAERAVTGISLVAAALLAATLLRPVFWVGVINGGPRGTSGLQPMLWQGVLLLSIIGGVFILHRTTSLPVLPRSASGRARLLHVGLTAIFLLIAVGTRIRSPGMSLNNTHLEAVLYSITQVEAGKTIFADLPAQYGGYAELLHPLFSAIGLSVFKFSLVMAMLQAVAVLALVLACFRLIRLKLLQVLAVLSLCMLVGTHWLMLGKFYSINNELYQLWPVRLLFPAVSLAGLIIVRERGMRAGDLAMLAVIAGIAIAWNLDSGVPVYGALVALLLVRLGLGPVEERRRNLRLLLLVCLVPVAVIGLFAAYLWFKSGGAIEWSKALKYQQIFYGIGFGMLPMPISPYPWMAVFGFYLFGMVCSLRRLAVRPSRSWDVVFFLCVLGIGLFTYYQGRSHDIVLTMVMWPAVIVAFVLADRVLRSIRARRLPVAAALSVAPVLVFGAMLSGMTLVSLPYFAFVAGWTGQTILSSTPTPAQSTIAFIKAKVGTARSAAILDPSQSVYFAETGLASAMSGPSLNEMILVEDRERMMEELSSGSVEHVFVRLIDKTKFPPELAVLLSRYKVLDTDETGLQYLEPVR